MTFLTHIGEGWIRAGVIFPFDRGSGAASISLIIGADEDVPFLPIPQLWSERFGDFGDQALVAFVWFGVGIAVHTMLRRNT